MSDRSTCLITGASRGLGLEFARQYAADGWRVFAACRAPIAATGLQQLKPDSAGALTVVTMDVTDAVGIRNAAGELKDVAVDVLINWAGIVGEPGQSVGQAPASLHGFASRLRSTP